MPGPAPKADAQRRRRNATVAMTKLPAGGRKGRAPAWPLAGKPTRAESALWVQLWHTPQAQAWERLGWTRVVGRYARTLIAAEHPDGAALLPEVRQLEDRLGLTPMSMLRLRWEVDSDEVAAQREKPAKAPAASARRRLKVVDGALAGS